ncbi:MULTISPECIES: ferredoxin--NADP reductase [unclassified Pseudomonas]|uniref:ferredoxin--NADP reductase n=1 Tax=unclassified Pseudomonas TaxID=196821 RepID=UPI000A1F9480|nr:MULTISPECIES: ferredoxin--NADP reductase [unclassified Pseudomonas]
MSGPIYHTLKVAQVIDETADAKSLVFAIPAVLADAFRYKPGQFLTLRLPIGDGFLPRCYSLASSPVADRELKVTIKRVRDGRGSNWVCDNITAGAQLQVMAPAGVFTPKSLDGDFLLFGGGSGITPVLSILRTVLASGTGNVCLVYANRDEGSIIFREALKALATQHPSRLQVIHWLDSVQGIPSVAQLRALARPWQHANCFICGPGPFMDASVEALKGLDIHPAQIHVERFVSLPEEGSEVMPILASSESREVVLQVTLDGQTHEVRGSNQETVLDAMLRAGIEAPYSCRAGACATCMCTVQKGAVSLQVNDVLDAHELEQGWTLACQAVPDSDHIVLRFPD